MNDARTNRRQLLQALGLGAGSLFLPSLMSDRQAYAGPANRLIVYYTQHGPGYENWRMRRPGLPDHDGDWELALDGVPEAEWSPVLQPLYAHRKDLLVLDGLGLTSAFADKGTNNHNAGTSHALAAAKMVIPAGFNGEGNGGGPSVDQIVAAQVAVPGRIKSLFYSSAYKPWSPSFQGANMPTAAEGSPAAAFTRLFPTGTAPGGTMPSEAERIRAARTSVLDLVKKEYAALAPTLGSADRQTLERHHDLVADLQTQIMGRGSITCAPPTKPTLGGDSGGTNARARTKAFIPLVAAAMSCDITRVAVLVAGQLDSADFGGPAGADVHQDIAHAAAPGTAAATQMANYYRVHAAEFGDLIGLCSNLLPNAILLWVNELASGPHDLYRVMAVMAGGGGGAFRTGRYIKYKETEPNPATFSYGGGKQRLGPPHSKLLVSIMQAMGVNQSSIGITSAVGNSSTTAGAPIDLTGPLPRLG
jgi:hypothetical protein